MQYGRGGQNSSSRTQLLMKHLGRKAEGYKLDGSLKEKSSAALLLILNVSWGTETRISRIGQNSFSKTQLVKGK